MFLWGTRIHRTDARDLPAPRDRPDGPGLRRRGDPGDGALVRARGPPTPPHAPGTGRTVVATASGTRRSAPATVPRADLGRRPGDRPPREFPERLGGPDARRRIL